MKKILTWLILIALWCLMAFLLAVPIFYISQNMLGMHTNKAGAWFVVLVPIALLKKYEVKGKIERAIDNSGQRVKEGVNELKEQRRIRKMKKMEEEIKLIREILREEEANKVSEDNKKE